MTPKVQLTPQQMAMAASCGTQRFLQSLFNGRRNDGVPEDERWSADIGGALGEMILAKSLNVFWTAGINTFKLPDVGPFQVRHTFRFNGRLIIRPRDWLECPREKFILTRGLGPEFEVCGWVLGEEGKLLGKTNEQNGRSPAQFIDASDLHGVETLILG